MPATPVLRALCSWAIAGIVTASLSAQRLPVPDPAARAAVQDDLLERLAAVMAPGAPDAPSAVEQLLATAAEPGTSPALRFELLQQAMRCARAAGDATAGVRAASRLEAGFVVDGASEAFLVRFVRESRAPAQTTVGACLDAAQQLVEHDGAGFATALTHASRLAAADVPPGLAAQCEFAANDLAKQRAVHQQVLAKPDDRALALRYRAFYRGEWPDRIEELGEDQNRIARMLRSKIEARAEPRDLVALARAGEQSLSQCRLEPDPLAQRHLSRRAARLLLQMACAEPPPVAEAAEIERVRRLLDRATADALAPGVGSLRFAVPGDANQLLIVEGAWRVEGNRLFGRSLGADTTRATAKFAWRRIDCITFRAGIQSADGLNLRIAVGPVNVLCNWEVADQNHFYFGQSLQVTQPRLLQQGREYTIQLRQLDDQVVVLVDGRPVAQGPGRLGGTVSIYPALGSEIFVSSIDVVGDVDLGRVVTGPDLAH